MCNYRFEFTGDAVIYMDTDLQDPPELIPKLIEEYERAAILYIQLERKGGETIFKLFIKACL